MKRKNIADDKSLKKQRKGLSQEEIQIIESGIGDYSKCARMYIDNVVKNLGSIKYKGQGSENPNQTSKIYNRATKKLTSLEDFQKGLLNGLKVKDDYISNMFRVYFQMMENI